jgi:hypothetical protein
VVKVLVGQHREHGRFSGFWAEFEGEEVSSYEKDDVVYTLYKATGYDYEAYRVYISDETDPKSPVYELRPFSEDRFMQGAGPDYTEPYRREDVVAEYPLFIKRAAEKDENIDHFQTRNVDPTRWPP